MIKAVINMVSHSLTVADQGDSRGWNPPFFLTLKTAFE